MKKDAMEIGAELNKQKDIISKNNTQLRTEINNILKSNPILLKKIKWIFQ